MRLKNVLPTPKTTVLAVDDNQASLDLIRMILQNGDYTVADRGQWPACPGGA